MLLYSFHIYYWSVSLLEAIDRWIRNFVWSVDIYTKKIVTISWSKVCCSTAKGGLDLKSIRAINNAATLKLSWDFAHSNEEWATFLRDRFIKKNGPASYYIGSSIWSAIKKHLHTAYTNSSWILGDGRKINF